MDIPKEYKSPYTTAQYKFVCELIWGGPPVDRQWAEGTKFFQEKVTGLLEQYPMLNKSFFEQHKIN